MLFYATLLITSFLLALVIIGLKNLLVVIVRRAFSLGKSHVKVGPTAHLNQKTPGGSPKVASSAWGTKPHATPANLAKTQPAVTQYTPWGWPGNSHETHKSHPGPAAAKEATLSAYMARKYVEHQPLADWRLNTGRPLRDQRSALAGAAYKPGKDVMTKCEADKKGNRPWGW